MAVVDWSQCPFVESIPGKVSGAWVFRGTRVPVSAVFENLQCSPIEEILENFPVSREAVMGVLEFAGMAGRDAGGGRELAAMTAQERRELVDSIRGKYRDVPTSSELFMAWKRDDTE